MNATSHTIFELQIIATNSLRLLDYNFFPLHVRTFEVFSNDQQTYHPIFAFWNKIVGGILNN